MKILQFKAIYITASATILIVLTLLILPRVFIYWDPEVVKSELPPLDLSRELVLEEIISGDLNTWIKTNMEKSIIFNTENMTKDTRISRAIVKNSLKNNIPVNLAFSVAFKESKFKINAYNDNGKSRDRGLFQLNDSYRQNWAVEDFYNVEKNSFEGTRYLKEMIELNEQDIQKALYCYNAGPTKVRKYGIIPEGTKNYAVEILKIENEFNNLLKKWIINYYFVFP